MWHSNLGALTGCMRWSTALASLFLVIWVVAIVAFGFWLRRARPSHIYRRYPRHVTKQFAVPFSNTWKRQVDPADIGIIHDWRRRCAARYLILVGLPALLFTGYIVFWGLQLRGRTEALIERSQTQLEILRSQKRPPSSETTRSQP